MEQKKLTLFGKVIVINTLAIPKITYNCSLLPVPEHVIVKIEDLLSHFCGMGKTE